MAVVLHYGIVKAALKSSVSQDFGPVSLTLVAENPSAIILDLEDDKSGTCSHGQVYLRILAIRFLEVYVVKYCSRIDTHLQKFQHETTLRALAPGQRCRLLNELVVTGIDVTPIRNGRNNPKKI